MGTPTLNFPLFILGPAAIFYIALVAQGYSLDDARDLGWLFPEASSYNFWAQWEELYDLESVHWQVHPNPDPSSLTPSPTAHPKSKPKPAPEPQTPTCQPQASAPAPTAAPTRTCSDRRCPPCCPPGS